MPVFFGNCGSKPVMIVRFHFIYCCKCFECNILAAFTTVNNEKIHYNDSFAAAVSTKLAFGLQSCWVYFKIFNGSEHTIGTALSRRRVSSSLTQVDI